MIWTLFLVLGCAGVLDLSRATPLAPGEMRFQAGTAAGAQVTTTAYPGVRFAAGVHAGLSPGVEVGGGLGALISPGVVPIFLSDASVDAKFRFGEVPDSRLHLALNPRIRLSDWNEAWFPVTVELPLLVGYDVGPSQVVLVPRAGLFVDFGEGPRATPQVGVTLGWVLPVSEDLEIVPGIGADWTASRDESAAGVKAGAVTVAAGISFAVAIE